MNVDEGVDEITDDKCGSWGVHVGKIEEKRSLVILPALMVTVRFSLLLPKDITYTVSLHISPPSGVTESSYR